MLSREYTLAHLLIYANKVKTNIEDAGAIEGLSAGHAIVNGMIGGLSAGRSSVQHLLICFEFLHLFDSSVQQNSLPFDFRGVMEMRVDNYRKILSNVENDPSNFLLITFREVEFIDFCNNNVKLLCERSIALVRLQLTRNDIDSGYRDFLSSRVEILQIINNILQNSVEELQDEQLNQLVLIIMESDLELQILGDTTVEALLGRNLEIHQELSLPSPSEEPGESFCARLFSWLPSFGFVSAAVHPAQDEEDCASSLTVGAAAALVAAAVIGEGSGL